VKAPVLIVLLAAAAPAQTWIPHASGVKASLRGVSAISSRIIWASGASGTVLLSVDGGATWRRPRVPDSEGLDFRDGQAFDERSAYLLAIGPGEKSRIYRTGDAGEHWSLQHTNSDPTGFLDAFAFWDRKSGVVFGDSVNGEFAILTTSDGGSHWERRRGPAALPNEGAFAASGTSIITLGKSDCWFATGGEGAARVFHSADRGRTWTVATTPIRNDAASAGIFSLAFRDARFGIAAGGEYKKPGESSHNIAITSDGGKTWREPRGSAPGGYRSAVVYAPSKRAWIAVGTSGSDISMDEGENWRSFDGVGYNALSVASDGSVWAVGPDGRIAEFR
jgi:photosystem II stability/assembly factor-like uncharacterized protein